MPSHSRGCAMALLELSDVTVRFGGRVAIDHVSLTVEAGQITGLIGPNGAGKTTLFNVVTGAHRPDTGRIVLDGSDLAGRPPFKRARLGIARTFQLLELFGSLTVSENISVAAAVHRRHARAAESVADVTERIICRLGLTDVAGVRADLLPTGRGRLVELGRALASAPRVLLVDEPASGQDERETEQLAEVLRDLRASGLAVLLVEHDVSLVMQVCDHLYVLDFGQLIASGPPDEIRANPRVRASYLGEATVDVKAGP